MSASGTPQALASARQNSRAADHCLSQAMAFSGHDERRAARLRDDAEAALIAALASLRAHSDSPVAQLVKHAAVLTISIGSLWYCLGGIAA